ncbi:unnamed protein product [Gongylonema pulchrum]|uniref:G_PROTEIN_RECEP_F1_2 domain-containing protein n=1 Tax=Gongylonema pulchrum TaxID=637853 RepID=A0A183DZ84_9BILA|nr:unnamed protein product [Gongylonema pulchrum]
MKKLLSCIDGEGELYPLNRIFTPVCFSEETVSKEMVQIEVLDDKAVDRGKKNASDYFASKKSKNHLFANLEKVFLLHIAGIIRFRRFVVPRRKTVALHQRVQQITIIQLILLFHMTPTWRRQLRSRVFRTTLLVVLTHVIFWFPYNFYSLMKYIDIEFYAQMSEHANVFKDLQILITLINPFLYGFSR